jgi:uncharacterized protein (TIGR03437 family)
VNSAATTITITGSGFASGAQVYFNGAPLSTTYVNAGQLTAVIPATSLTQVLNASVTVVSNGQTSNALTFSVGTTSTSGISITCNPTVGPASAGSTYTTNCTATGGKGPYNWTAIGLPFGLVLTYSTSNTVSITGTLLAGTQYNYNLQVTDSSTPVLTASYPFVGSVPGATGAAITSLSPISVPSGSGQTTLLLTGSGFTSGGGAVVQFGGILLPTTVNSDNQITAIIPASSLATPGTINVQLVGTVASNTVGFFVTSGTVAGVSPTSLNFTYGIGGTLPPAQTLSVSSLGGATGFSVVPNGVANGITWLVLSQPSAAIPGSVSVSVMPGALPLGTYTGSLTLTAFGTGTTVSVPVTLTVTGSPALTPSPSNLNLTVAAGGTTTQTVKVTTSDGTTVLPYTIAAISNNGGNWLSVSPTSGTTPGSFTVTASGANLTPSTYSGTITLTSTGSLNSQVSIPVSLVVTAPVSISVSPASLSFSGLTGGSSPAAQNITVSAANNAAVAYTVASTTQSGGNWLSATASGTTPGVISVSVNTANLTAATYTGSVTVTAPGSSNSPVNIPVTLVVSAPPTLTVSPQSLTFNYQVGRATPATQALAINLPSGASSVAFTVTAATGSGGNWLSTSPTSGTTPGSVAVAVAPASLAAGTYSGTLTITGTGAASATVPVTLNVTAAPTGTLAVSPFSLTFNSTVSGGAPASQTLAITSTNSVALNYTVTANSPGNWLTATGNGTTPGTVTVSVNPSGLVVGQYTGYVVITSSSASNSPYTLQVILNVTNPAPIVASPSSLAFFIPADGSTPAPQSVAVLSTGGATSFTATAVSQGGNWLTVSGGGQTPGSLMVSVNPAGLQPGQTYNGAISITAPNATPSNIQVPVTVTVAPQGAVALQVLPQAVYLSYTQGSGTDLQHVTVLNNGGGTVNFSAQATTTSCGSWLTVVTPVGSATASSPGLIAFDVNPSGLNSQTCRATLTVTDSNNNTTTIPVFMAISGQSQAVLLSQTAMNFIAGANGSAPAAQTFQILNPGSGSMPWSVATQVLSGGSWLTATPNSGSSQSLSQVGTPISVAVNPQGLAAGTYYGTVQVTSSGAFNSPQMISVTFTVLASATTPPAQLTPSAVILTGSGGSTSDTQTVNISNLSSGMESFTSALITDDGQNWLVASPSSGTIAAGGTNAINLSANLAGLSGGLRHGTLRIAFSDGSVQTVDVRLAISGAGGATGVGACGSGNLALEFLSPAQNFQATARVAIPLQVLVKDCSGNLLNSSTAGVDVISGSTDIHLNYVGNGTWSGTYTPSAAATVLTLTARAVSISGGGAATGAVTATGVAGPAVAGGPPYVSAVVNAASYLFPGLVAPGTMVSIFGSGLADGQSNVFSTPFPSVLQGAKFTVRGVSMPLFYASDGQVNGIIPLGLNPNERDQLVVVRDTTLSAPVDVLVADVDPGIFATNQQGTGQGAILVGGTSQVAGPAGSVQGAGPATVGQYLSIFLSGLGTVSNPPADGSPATGGSSTTPSTPTVTIGGVPATVSYSGLAPGEVGLYQVNVQVPAGVPTGNAVPVVVTLGNGVSNTVTIALQ